ncbi:MAG TPA: DUF3479 domain-containing protein, partial [Woeseiaceae bacterium]|nr:DUF3479 domain-containing protein [Woeseiaceae bacterium]
MVTLDSHMASAVERAHRQLRRELPGLSMHLHVATEWTADEDALARCREDIARADIIVVTMMFMDDHIQP